MLAPSGWAAGGHPQNQRLGLQSEMEPPPGSVNKALFTIQGAHRQGPQVRSRAHSDPQAADEGSEEPGLHIQFPAGLGHQQARSQATQEDEGRQCLLQTQAGLDALPWKPVPPLRVHRVVEFYEQPRARVGAGGQE